ncbi:MAG TPA: hypothetical protein VFM44_01320 [Gemmatimonadota bacterium]|jgi:hypothetical protein|nr:hypothetical protein [Gemmatimonadota bacterium]
MRTIVSGLLAAAAYWIVIAAFVAVSMPSRAHMEAVIQSVRSADVTVVATQAFPLG